MKKDNPNEDFVPGDLVCVVSSGGVVKCDNNNTNLIGVVSDSYIVLGNDHEGDSNYVIVGLLGQIKTLVNAEGGEIKPGDFVTYSSVAGVGKKATEAGQAIGTAIEGGSSGKIEIYVNKTWFDPQVQLTSTGDLNIVDLTGNDPTFNNIHNFKLTDSLGNQINRVGAFSEVATGKLKAGLISSTQITTQALSVASENMTINGQNIRDYIASVSTSSALLTSANTQNQIASNSAQINANYVKASQLEISGDATISGTLQTGTLLASHIPALDSLTNRVANLESMVASLSSSFIDSFTNASSSAQFASVDSLNIQNATVSGDLMVLGRTTVSELGVTGKINSGLLVINGLDNSVAGSAGQT
jgi:hypothetical protein